jgi:putative flippase GtrA
MLASGAATVTDQAVLFVSVVLLGIAPRSASVPALLCAGIVNFLANRSFAFRDRGGSVVHQAPRFAFVQGVSIALNALIFDLGMRALEGHVHAYWALRLVVNNAVYLAWSYPMFGLVFPPREGNRLSLQ